MLSMDIIIISIVLNERHNTLIMFRVLVIFTFFSVLNCKIISIRSIVKANSWGNYTDGAVLYELNLEDKFELLIPKECSRSVICENIPDFPHETIAKLIKIMIADNVQFHKDKDYENKDNVNLFDADEESQELCDSKHVRFHPQAVKNRHGKWFIVLNSKYKMVQSFNGEVCLGGPKKSCSSIAFFNTSYEGRCVQKYRSASIIVLSNDLKQVIVKDTPVPTCCSCVAFKKN